VSATGVGDVAPGDRDALDGAALARDLEDYVGFGWHRTGSAGDRATSDWFARHFRAHGYTVEQEGVTCPDADTTVARLASRDLVLDGFAQPPLAFTPDAGVRAPLVTWDPAGPERVKDRIACVHVARTGPVAASAACREAFRQASAAGAIGIVGVVPSPCGAIAAINTPLGTTQPTPVLLVGERDRAALDRLVRSEHPVTLTLAGPGGERTGFSTIATRGREGDPWVVVSTPQSGWFTCGGERGPGVALLRALAAWAATQPFPVRWCFVATSGHEWDDAGAERFHRTRAPDPTDTVLWFHLGAGFGARAYDETPRGLVPRDTPNPVRTLMATPDLVPLCETAFAGHPTIGTPRPADPAAALGEYRLVLARGYPSCAGFWGANAHFHTPLDDASTTTAAIMAPIARGVAQVIARKLSAPVRHPRRAAAATRPAGLR
jgi:hypothetical protein